MRKQSNSVFGNTVFGLCIVVALLGSELSSAERGSRRAIPGRLAKSYIADTGHFDGNRIYDDLENTGMIVSHRITGHSGMEWPKGTHLYIDFASGIWIAGKVDGDIRTAVAEYGPEFVAGPWGSDASAAEHQLYIVNKGDLANPLANPDFQNWPADLGAPWVDADSDGVYSPLPLGADYPDFIGDQVIWWVMNDGDVSQHSIFNTLPLGIEVQMTIWGYNRPDAFGDMMFIKALIINKGGTDIDSTIIGLWSDPDLGYAGDDFVGSDTTLSLGFCYNDGADADYGGDPPAIGYDFFQGPIVPSVGDTAFAFGRYITDYKNLPMSSFTKYINGDPVYTDPNDAIEAYYYMTGYLRNGKPYINSATGEPSKFVHPDDPNLNVDANDSVWVDSDDHASGDRRFLMNAGPFSMAAGDSQEVVFGIIIARGSSALSSVTALKEADKLAQIAYDVQFALPPAPEPPVVTYTTQAREINLMWDTAQESYEAEDKLDKKPVAGATTQVTEWKAVATVTDSFLYGLSAYDTLGVYDPDSTYTSPVILLGAVSDTSYHMEEVVVKTITEYTDVNTKYMFEGYNIWQFDNATGSGNKWLVATYDKVNGVTEIKDQVFDASRGENVLVTVQRGSDSGVRNHFTITKDYLNGGIPLKTNRAYYFAVTAYGYNEYGIPKTLDSAPEILTIRPAISTTYDVAAEGEESFGDSVKHTSGVSDGSVDVVVVDPFQVTGHEYEVYFTEQHYYKNSEGQWITTNYPDSIGRTLGKVLDVSGSTVTATAFVDSAATKLDFTLKLVAPGGAWADGFKLTFPAGIYIQSASATGALYSYGDLGQNPVDMVIDRTANTVAWGDSTRSTFGGIEGTVTFSVVVDPFDPPISVGWVLYDDGYDGTIIDASGTVQITELQYEFKTRTVWNVKDLTTGADVVTLQTIVGGVDVLTDKKYSDGDDAGWTKFDGLKVRVHGAPPHSLKSTSWDESEGTIGNAYSLVEEYTDANGNGKYDSDEPYEDVGADGISDVFESGYVPTDKHNPDPNGDDYDATSNPLGEEGNGVWNPYPARGEPYTDSNGNGKYDIGEPFEDIGTDRLASPDERGYLLMNLDPAGDNYRTTPDTVSTTPLIILPINLAGTEGNKAYDVGEPYTDVNLNSTWDAAETYVDVNDNGAYDGGYAGPTWLEVHLAETFYNWWGSSGNPGTSYPKVELRFVQMDSLVDPDGDGYTPGKIGVSLGDEYFWDTSDPNAGYADMYQTWGPGHYLGYYPVPFTAWNMDTNPPTQLHIVQRDRDGNKRYDAGTSLTWNYIWITNLPYTGQAIFDPAAGGDDWMDIIDDAPAYYILWLDPAVGSDSKEAGGKFLARSGTFTFDPKRDNLPGETFKFSTKGAVAKAFDLKAINVWPNPYFGYNPEERTPLQRMMQFTHLPNDKSTIRIFNLAGQLVKKIKHDNGTQYEIWDLTNNFNIPVGSGMYIAHIETEHGDRILKLAVIQPQERLDVY